MIIKYHRSGLRLPFYDPVAYCDSSVMTKSNTAYKPYKKERGTMVYTPTNVEESNGGIIESVRNFIEQLYWMYYVHLPYYLMTDFDAFCLHTLFLVMFILSLFGLVKWLVSLYGILDQSWKGLMYVSSDQLG
ncbi:HGR025Cp [Eremothecium sinecaudum]|uniref:HGR025Cp n=1 Tax=Eremothecium sinecaudum TaxID=45286 RepID=A0A0X8HVN2_9SACH|nr:HGR025Cp [Eremothecium sinecaudum]AMD22364.1 HGR025Cp [Eremothecium sinecaudum]